MVMPLEAEEKTRSQVAPYVGDAPPRVFAIWDGGYASSTLPASGALLIGRGNSADLRISSTSVSREHARIHAGVSPTIEDLGSSNGWRRGKWSSLAVRCSSYKPRARLPRARFAWRRALPRARWSACIAWRTSWRRAP